MTKPSLLEEVETELREESGYNAAIRLTGIHAILSFTGRVLLIFCIIFVAMKLTDNLAWSWWAILTPLYGLFVVTLLRLALHGGFMR